MKKLFSTLVALVAAITMMAQTPTVSTSSITLRYCTTKTHTETVNLPEANFPYIWDGQSIATEGTYERLYTAADGCDSIATLVLNKLVTPKFKAFAQGQIIYGASYNVLTSGTNGWKSLFHARGNA